MKTLEDRINETFDIAIYLQLMGSFVPGANFEQIKDVVLSTQDFFTKSSESEIESNLPFLNSTLQDMAELFIEKYPVKKDIGAIAYSWNELFKNGDDIYNYGITYGWLEELMDLKNLNMYDYVPYHFKIGLATHKSHGGIEEEFLLKDAFNVLLKAEYYFEILVKFGEKLKKQEETSGLSCFNHDVYKKITDIKYEVAAFSRLTIISFYAFIECFVNSIGFSYLQRNKSSLSEDETQLLMGLKKGRFLQLKSKIERFQKIIRVDKKSKIVTSDNKQAKEPFISFFNQYEELRNASIHYSPLKEQIWLKPDDWVEKARKFSKIAVDVGLEIWQSCFEDPTGPQYLGKLDYDLHYNFSKQRLSSIEKIQIELINSETE